MQRKGGGGGGGPVALTQALIRLSHVTQQLAGTPKGRVFLGSALLTSHGECVRDIHAKHSCSLSAGGGGGVHDEQLSAAWTKLL